MTPDSAAGRETLWQKSQQRLHWDGCRGVDLDAWPNPEREERSGSVPDALQGFLVGRFVRAIPDASPVSIDRDFGRDST